MHNHLQYRWIFPPLMTLVNICLLVLNLIQQPSVRNGLFDSTSARNQQVVFQDGTIVFQPTQPPKTSTVLKAAIILNLPVVWVAFILAGLLRHEGDSMYIGLSTIFVPFLWYSIGGWLDSQLRTVITEPRKKSKLSSQFRKLLRVVAAFFLACSILGIAPTHSHRTSETNFLFGTIMLWSASYLGCSFWGERRHRPTD
jgi:hypothetical protein